MPDDELDISVNFDASSAQAGMDALAASAQETTQVISAAFSSLVDNATEKVSQLEVRLTEANAAFEQAAIKAEELQGRSIGAEGGGDAAAAYTEATSAEVAAIQEVEAVTAALAAARQELASVTAAAATAEASLGEMISAQAAEVEAADEAWAQLAAQVAAIPGVVDAVATSNEAVGSSLEDIVVLQEEYAAAATESAAAEEALSAAVNELNAAYAGQTATLEEITGLQEAVNAASAEAAAAQQERLDAETALQAAISGTSAELEAEAAAEEASATAYAEAGGILNQYQVTLDEAAASNTELSAAVDQLNTEVEKGVGNLASIEAAFSAVSAAAEKAGFDVEETANGMRILSVAEEQVVQETRNVSSSMNDMGGMMAYVSARAAAMEAGVGQLGFGLGLLARNSSILGPIFQAAFPIIGAVLMIEVIDNLIQKFENLELSITKSTVQFDDLAASQVRAAEAIDVQNLKLEDQINKFEGRPTENRLAIATEEAQQKVDNLNKSLEDTLEKELQLLETGEIGFFKGLVTNTEPTKDLHAALKPLLEDYLLAASKVTEASTKLQIEESDANEKGLADAQATLAAKKTLLDKGISDQEEAIAKQRSTLESSHTVTAPGPGFQGTTTTTVPGLDPSQVDKILGPLESQITAIHNVELGYELQNKQLQRQQELMQENAGAADDAEDRARARTVDEGSLKANERISLESVNVAKREAEETFKIAEASAKSDAQSAIEGGENRYKAEIEANNKIVNARRQLTTDLLQLNRQQTDVALAAAQTQLGIDEATEVGPKREAAVAADNARISQLEIQAQADQRQIASDGGLAILAIETRTTEDLVKVQEDRTRKILNELSRELAETKRIAEEEAKAQKAQLAEQTAEQQAPLKTESKIATLEAKGGGGLVADVIELRETERITGQEIAIIKQAAAEAIQIEEDKTNTIVAELNRQLQETNKMYLSGEIGQADYNKRIEDLTRQISSIRNQSADREVEIDANAKRQEIQIAEKESQQEMQLQVQIADGLARQFDHMLFQARSFQEAMSSLWQGLVRMIIDEILKMVAAWIVAHVIMKAVSELFHKEQKPLTPGPGEPGVATTGRAASPDVTPPPIIGSTAGAENEAQKTKDVALTHQLATAKTQLATADTQVATTTTTETAAIQAQQVPTTALIPSLKGLTQAEQDVTTHMGAAATATAAASSASLSLIGSNASLATSDIGVSAAKVFMQAIDSIPFPANLAAAPAMAAQVVAQGAPFIAMASAEGGWNVPDNPGASFPTLVHPQEMVLDRATAQGFRAIISRGMMASAPGHATEASSAFNLNYYAGDMHAPAGVGVEDMIAGQHKSIGKIVHGLIRTGRINPQQFARKVR